MAAAGTAYAQAEGANAGGLSGAATGPTAVTTPLITALADPPVTFITNLVLGASGYPIPSQEYIDGIPPLYLRFWGTGNINIGVNTPEGLYPLTGVNSLTFDTSAAQGLTILDNAIHTAFNTGSTQVNVFGYSQSAVIASLEMQALNPTNTPGGSPLNLNFTLVGDPSNPNGGLLSRFPGLSLPSLGLDLFGTATPDNSFPTRIYTIEYDGFGDFPQYPIDFLSDVNAFLGIIELHGDYPFLTPLQIDMATQLGVQGDSLTQYYVVDTGHFPLTDFIRDIPVVGNPVADLLEPDLKVLVDLGYGSTDLGYSTTPANIPTPFGVLPPVPPGQILSALATGTQQGVSAFVGDIHAGLSSSFNTLTHLSPSDVTSAIQSIGDQVPTVPPGVISALSSPSSFIQALEATNTRIANAIAGSASAAYGTLLPTADVLNALVTAVPSYDVNLFLDGIKEIAGGDIGDGLIYALGAPVAADTALVTLFAGFEFRVFEHAATQIIDDWTGTTPASTGTVGLLGL